MSVIRLVSHAQFDDSQDLLITGGVDGVYVFNFDYQGKYEPKIASQVDTKGSYIKIALLNQNPIEKMVQWCSGLKTNSKSGLIMSWNSIDNNQYLSINTLAHNASLICQFKNVTNYEEKIEDVLVLTDYRYILASTSEGNIIVLKL